MRRRLDRCEELRYRVGARTGLSAWLSRLGPLGSWCERLVRRRRLYPLRDCGQAAGPSFCPHCGQEVEPRSGPFFEVLREVLSDGLSLDSQLLRSLAALVRPGRLSVLYLNGQRAPFLRPFRLYLIASLVLFSTVLTLEAPDARGYDIYLGNELIAAADPAPESGGAGSATAAGTRDSSVETRRALQLMKEDTLVDRWIVHLVSERIDRLRELRRQELVDVLFGGLRRMLPLTLILFVPFLALGLKLLYIRGQAPRTLYLDHLVFALHFQSALFFALAAGWLICRSASFGFVLSAIVYAVISLVVLMVYLPVALRRFYGQSRRWTAVKTLVVLFFYSRLLSIAVSLSILIGVWNV